MAKNKNKVEMFVYDKNLDKFIIKSKEVSTTTNFGKIDSSIQLNAKSGDLLTLKETELIFIDASFRDKYLYMRKGAQSIKLKDCATILAETLVGRDSVCLDCGAGMGGLSIFLARYVKKVFSCDVRKDHLDNAKFNADNLGISNIEFKEFDIYDGIPINSKFDLITLDLPSPEKVVSHAKSKLKPGAFLVAYCPQAIQMHKFVQEAKSENFEIVKCLEVIHRDWKVDERILRPEHVGLQHTAFLVFVRKIW